MPNSTLPAGEMMLASALQRDTPKALISGGRTSVIRHVRGPDQPSEDRMDRAKPVRKMPYLHGQGSVTLLMIIEQLCNSVAFSMYIRQELMTESVKKMQACHYNYDSGHELLQGHKKMRVHQNDMEG